MAGKIVSFVNLKGGVGKTSLSVNTGVALAANLGKKVLIIDTDPQASASLLLMGLDQWINRTKKQQTHTTYGLISGKSSVAQCIVKSPINHPYGHVEASKLDLIPSTFHLLLFEEETESKEGRQPYYMRFWNQISILKDIYDYIIIDCPPSFFKATKSAVFCCDHILAPCNPDSLSLMGLDLLAVRVNEFTRRTAVDHETARPSDPLPRIRGVILNDVHHTFSTVNRQAEARMKRRVTRLVRKGYAHPSAELFSVKIRNAAALQRGSFEFRPLMFTKFPKMDLLDDYKKLAQLITQL